MYSWYYRLKQLSFAYLNHARIFSWNQPELSNEVKVSCPRKQTKLKTNYVSDVQTYSVFQEAK